jgi:beta-phosphoglucomutase family hydrolase
MNKAVLWDMDGVLVDTGEFHFQAWQAVLAEQSILYTRDLFRQTFGMNNAGSLALILGQEPSPELLDTIDTHKEQAFRRLIRGRVQPLPGVVAWLARLQEQGFRQAVASSAPPENIDALVGELGLRPYFAAIVPGNDMPSKPDPALFLHAAGLLGVPPSRCAVVEDAVAGVEAARRAGMACLAVTTTNRAAALAAADLVVERLDALPPDTFHRLLAQQPP